MIVITKMALATFVHRRAPRGIRRLRDGRHIAPTPCLATCLRMLGIAPTTVGAQPDRRAMAFSNRRIGLVGVALAVGLALSSGSRIRRRAALGRGHRKCVKGASGHTGPDDVAR